MRKNHYIRKPVQNLAAFLAKNTVFLRARLSIRKINTPNAAIFGKDITSKASDGTLQAR